MPRKPPATAEDRLVLACETIAHDIAGMMIAAHPQAPPSDPTVNVLLGMTLALGRIYESVTGNAVHTIGPKNLLKWATNLKQKETYRVNS